MTFMPAFTMFIGSNDPSDNLLSDAKRTELGIFESMVIASLFFQLGRIKDFLFDITKEVLFEE